MTWSVWGDTISGASKNTTISVSVPTIIRGIRTRIIAYGNPTYTSITAKLYVWDGNYSVTFGTPFAQSSTTYTKAQIQTEDNAIKELYFEFPEKTLRPGIQYYFDLQLTGYAFADASHLAWVKGWPDPVAKPSGFVPTAENLSTAPYYLYLIGEAL